MPQTVIDLGQKIKKAYPDTPEYKNLSDAELGRKYKAAYPDSYSSFTDASSDSHGASSSFELPYSETKAEAGAASINVEKPQVKSNTSLTDLITEVGKLALHPSEPLIQSKKAIETVKSYLKNNTLNDKLADLSSVAKTGASTAVGALGTMGSGPAGGSVAMAGTEAVLNKITGQSNKTLLGTVFPSKDKNNDTIKATLEGAVENELAGKLLEGAGSLASRITKGAASYLSGASKLPIGEVPLTTAQTMEHGTAKQRIVKWLEDVGATPQKEAAVTAQNESLVGKGEELASNLGRGTQVDLLSKSSDTSRTLAEQIQNNEVKGNFASSIQASNKTAEGVRIIAEANNPAKLVGNTPVVSGTKLPPNVDGPVYLKNTLEAANKYITEANAGLVSQDPENPVLKAAQKLISLTNAEFDKTGAVIKANPISFDQAWQFKKDAGDLAFGNPLSDTGLKDIKFKGVYSALDKDIGSSLEQWPNNGQQAKNLWDRTKQIVSNRYEQFAPQNEVGAKVKDLLNSKDVQIDKLDQIISEPSKLQRLINTGDTSLLANPGQSKGAYTSVAPTNLRDKLKTYQFSRLYQDSLIKDEAGNTTPNPKKMWETWEGVKNSESMRILYNRNERDQISQFLKQVALTNEKFSTRGSHMLQYRGMYAVLGAGAGLTGYLLDGLSPAHAMITGGAVGGFLFSINQLGKLAINPQTARIVQSMAADQMSVPSKFAARAIANVLKGETVKLLKTDGTTSEVKFKK